MRAMSETSPDEPKVVLLVDGSSYLYRAFHAMPDLRAVPGDPASPALLGAYALEGLRLAADPVARRLVPVPGLLLQACLST